MKQKTQKRIDSEHQIAQKVAVLKNSGKPIDLAAINSIAAALGVSEHVVFNAPAVRAELPAFTASKDANNPNFMEITGSGFELVFKVGRYSKEKRDCSTLYLVRNNKPYHRVKFDKSGRSAEHLCEIAPRSQRFTHLDNAMAEAVAWIREQKSTGAL